MYLDITMLRYLCRKTKQKYYGRKCISHYSHIDDHKGL